MNAERLADRYGDATLLLTLHAIVTGKHSWSEIWFETGAGEPRKNLARQVVSDYGRAAREQILTEFPWVLQTVQRLKNAQ